MKKLNECLCELLIDGEQANGTDTPTEYGGDYVDGDELEVCVQSKWLNLIRGNLIFTCLIGSTVKEGY